MSKRLPAVIILGIILFFTVSPAVMAHTVPAPLNTDNTTVFFGDPLIMDDSLISSIDSLASAMTSLSDAVIIIFRLLLALGILALAKWEKDIIFYIVAGLVTIYLALSWTSSFPELAVPVFGLGCYELARAVLMAVQGSKGRGFSRFRGIIDRIKGSIE